MEDIAKTDSPNGDTPASGLMIHGIIFASNEAISASIKEGAKRTAAHTVSKQMSKVVDLVDLPQLEKGVWKTWLTAVKQLINITGSAAAFIDDDIPLEDMSPTLIARRFWWYKTLSTANTSIIIPGYASPRQMLEIIVANNVNKSIVSKVEAARAFWEYAPGRINLRTYLSEHVKRFNNLRPHLEIMPSVNEHILAVFMGRIATISPELGNRIRGMSYDDAINECHEWMAGIKTSAPRKGGKNNKTCNFCKNKVHLEAEYKALQLLARTTMVSKPLFGGIFDQSDGAMPTQIDNTAAILVAESRKISAEQTLPDG